MYIDDYDRAQLLGDNFDECGSIFDKRTTDKLSDNINVSQNCALASMPGGENEIQKYARKEDVEK